jgi:hypothetical protein
LTPFEESLAAKLAYEWKIIYRALVQADLEETFIVSIQKFDEICE